MDLLVMENHDGEGIFPLFTKGTAISSLAPCENTPHWCSCTINGYETYIPETYVGDGVLLKDYNPTELVVKKEQIVTLEKVVFEWLYVKDKNGRNGGFLQTKSLQFERLMRLSAYKAHQHND